MNTSKFIPSLILFMALIISGHGQHFSNVWYFGENAGLHFSSGQAQPLSNSALQSLEGCSSISDSASGQLLFYSNGEKVWNRNHRVMPNGNHIGGNTSSAQSALIIPMPGSRHLYYIFTTSDLVGGKRLAYSVIDMLASGGLGAVISTSNTLMTNSGERMAANMHSNKKDIWLVAHSYSDNKFYSFLVSSTGVSLPIVSGTGLPDFSGTGCLKFSHSGKKLGMAFRTQNTYELYDFDRSTGFVNAVVQLTDTFHLGYGLEFSPNEEKLYFHRSRRYAADRTVVHEAELFQMDISHSSPALMLASISKVGNFGVDHPGSFQLAPDGKIYIARFDAYDLACVQNPNLDAASCGFMDRHINLLGRRCKFGLPNTVQQFFLPQPTFTFENTCQFDSISFSISEDIAIDSVIWNFGDPLSGVHNIKKGKNSFHIYSMPGDFTVRNIFFRGNCSDTIVKNIHITPIPYSILGMDTSICPGTSLRLNARIPATSIDTFYYEWMDGSQDFQLQATTAGKYYLDIRNHCGTISDTLNLTFRTLPDADLGSDILICEGDIHTLAPSFQTGVAYRWSNGSRSPRLRVQFPGIYWLKANDVCGSDSDSINVEVETKFDIDIGHDTLLCDGATVFLDALPSQPQNHIQFLWQDSSIMPHYLAHKTGLYHVLVRAEVCEARDSIQIDFLKSPDVNLGYDTILCAGQFINLSAYHPLSIYSWENGSTGPFRKIWYEGIYAVQTSNMCGWSVDTIEILAYKKPHINLGNDTTICPFRPIILDAQAQGIRGLSYVWQDGSQEATREISAGKAYIVTVSNHCGIDMDTVQVVSDVERCQCNAFVPNVFTPNNDGINDKFAVAYPCHLIRYQLNIYDRWGRLVYGSVDPLGSWDGYCRSEACPSGIYYYVLNYRSHTGLVDNSNILKGHLTLLR